MTAFPGFCVRIYWAETRKAGFARSAISSEEKVAAACEWFRKEWAAGAVSLWTNSVKSRCRRARGTPSRDQAANTASRKSNSTPTLSPGTIRKRGSEAVAATIAEPRRYVASRWSADYAAPPGRVDPRGRKSGAGSGAENPRLPARAEGEKRFRSATRNP